MKILELQDSKVIISPEALGLSFFKTLWSRDKSKTKDKAYKDISYVFYFSDFNSPFYSYPPDQREGLIRQFVVGDKDFKVDSDILSAIESYKELNTTPGMRMLEAIQIAISKMEDYFRNVDYEVNDIDKVGKFIERVPKLIASVNEAIEICKKETVTSNRVRGGATVGLFEDK